MAKYEKVLQRFTAEQWEQVKTLATRFSMSRSELVRWAIDIGLAALSILSKLPIDIRPSRGMMDTEPNETGSNEDGNDTISEVGQAGRDG